MTDLNDSEADLYRTELEEHVEGLDTALLTLEETNDPEAVAAAFRHLHSLKGGSAAMGFPGVQQLAHRLEDAFSVIRDSGDAPSPELIAAAFDANDQFRHHLELLAIDGAEAPGDDIRVPADLMDRISALVDGVPDRSVDTTITAADPGAEMAVDPLGAAAGSDVVSAKAHEGATQPERHSDADPTVEELLATPEPTGHLAIALDGSIPLIDLKARTILQRLGEVAEIDEPVTPVEELDTVGFALTIPVHGSIDQTAVADALDMDGVLGWRNSDGPEPPAIRSAANVPHALRVGEEPMADLQAAAPVPTAAPATVAPAPGAPVVSTNAPASSPSPAARAEERRTDRRQGEGVTSLRVGVAALDLLADLAGELVTTRSRLTETVTSVAGALDIAKGASAHDGLVQRLAVLEQLLPGVEERSLRVELATIVADMKIASEEVRVILRELESRGQLKSELVRVSEDVSSVVGRLQEATIDLRLVPLESVFRRFRRVVRDAANQSGKEVELVIRGERTGVDKRLIDGLSEPLTHLVRNAIDHGIEPGSERIQVGKPVRGQLVLSASQQGNSVVIELADDGRGIDVERVRRKLISDGRVDPDRAAQLSREDVLAYLSLPGVTTKDEVTELSGRGVGLDAVYSMISRLYGTVEMQTELGRGTTISMRLPSAMAIVHSLIVTIGQHHLGIPIEDVREVVSLDDVTITPVGDDSTMLLRGEFLPVVEIEDRLELPEDPDVEPNRRFAAVLNAGSREVACPIDLAVGTEDLVIKSIGDSMGTRRGLSGASFLGDGNVALIIDSAALLGGAL